MRTTFMGIFTASFVAVLPFLLSNQLFYGGENTKFFWLIAFVDVLLLCAAYFFWTEKKSVSLLGRWFLYSAILVLGVQYLAAFLGVDVSRSFWSDITRSTGLFFLTHILLAAYLLAALLKEGDWSLIRKTVALSAAVFSFLAFLGVDGLGFTGDILWFSLGTSGLSIANTTFAGAYLLLACILTLVELSRTKTWNTWRYALLASAGVMLLSPFFLNTGIFTGAVSFSALLDSPAKFLGEARASSAAAYALLLFMGGILLLKKLPKKIATSGMWSWSILWVLGIGIGLSLLFTSGSVVQKAYIETSTAARIVVWEGAWKSIVERPLLGWGPENFVYAFDTNFDNRLFLKENIGEIWFDRAHNVFVDTLSGSGVFGVGSFALLILAFWVVVWRAQKKKRIGNTEAILLGALPVAHIVQSQTGFDTVSSYVLLAVIAGYILWLENEINEEKSYAVPLRAKQGIAVFLVLLSLASAKFALLDPLTRQAALFTTFKTQDDAERFAAIETSLAGDVDFETLRMSSFSFIKGFLQQIGEGRVTEASAKIGKEIIDIYDAKYQVFIEAHPDHYRARVDYAYLLLIKTIMGENRLSDAEDILKDTYALSPNNPLTYYVAALGKTYGGNFAEAKALIATAKALNPDIELSTSIEKYIKDQERSFPEISILKLENI